jgi:ribosomal-protein-alanine N-acetyltransferase
VVAFFEACRLAGEMLHLVIADAGDDVYLGEVMLNMGESGGGELGCGLLQGVRGWGIATQSLRMLAEWSLAALGLGRVQAMVAVENTAGLRLVERAGFRREGVLRSYWEHDGVRHDCVMVSLLPQDLVQS